MKSRIIMILLFLPICLMAQFTEYNSSVFFLFCDSPNADIKHGIDNFNFDKSNTLDKEVYKNYKIKISVGCLTDINSSKHNKFNNDYEENEEEQWFKNKSNISPEFFISYNVNDYNLQIKNYYSKYLNPKQLIGTSIYQSYDLGKMKFHLSNKVLYFAVNKKINQSMFASAGILTNNFNYILKWTNYDKESYAKTDYFDQFQFTGSFCYLINSKFGVYFHFKTQQSKVKLSSNKITLPEDYSEKNNSVVTYPGLLSFGFQYRFMSTFMISLEMLNHIIFANENYVTHHSSGIDRTYHYKHNTWNPELVLEFNYLLIKNLQLGIQYSRYLKYDNEINELDRYTQRKYEIHSPQAVILSSIYRLNKKIEISALYQFSYAKTDYYHDYGDFYDEGYYKDLSHYLKLVLSAFIF